MGEKKYYLSVDTRVDSPYVVTQLPLCAWTDVWEKSFYGNLQMEMKNDQMFAENQLIIYDLLSFEASLT